MPARVVLPVELVSYWQFSIRSLISPLVKQEATWCSLRWCRKLQVGVFISFVPRKEASNQRDWLSTVATTRMEKHLWHFFLPWVHSLYIYIFTCLPLLLYLLLPFYCALRWQPFLRFFRWCFWLHSIPFNFCFITSLFDSIIWLHYSIPLLLLYYRNEGWPSWLWLSVSRHQEGLIRALQLVISGRYHTSRISISRVRSPLIGSR